MLRSGCPFLSRTGISESDAWLSIGVALRNARGEDGPESHDERAARIVEPYRRVQVPSGA